MTSSLCSGLLLTSSLPPPTVVCHTPAWSLLTNSLPSPYQVGVSISGLGSDTLFIELSLISYVNIICLTFEHQTAFYKPLSCEFNIFCPLVPFNYFLYLSYMYICVCVYVYTHRHIHICAQIDTHILWKEIQSGCSQSLFDQKETELF